MSAGKIAFSSATVVSDRGGNSNPAAQAASVNRPRLPPEIDTELTRRVVGPAEMDALLAQVPARRLGQPAEIAAFVSWLAGPENTYITGQNIAVDGGFTRV